jgi:medium-chain acyl-[acyl-carrier-protein] hydrolase
MMTGTHAPSRWLAFHRTNPAAKLRLFCFPYAGGGAALFQPWAKSLPRTVEVCPVQPPGRGDRLREPAFTSLGPLVQAVAEGLLPYLNKPFAFFGHSMGTLISFELARLLRREGRAQPAHLFLSGSNAPQLPSMNRPIYNLPEPELVAELRRLNGTPQEVLEHPELMQLMLPIIRADMAVCQTYSYAAEPPLDCSVSAFGGLQDVEVPREGVRAWHSQTNSSFTMWMLEGDHFFLHRSLPQMLRIISQTLANLKDEQANYPLPKLSQ